MKYWKFSKIKHIEELQFNTVLERFYKYGISGLVRENIQNSLDARLDKNLPVKVIIKLGEIYQDRIPGHQELINHIEALESGNVYAKETINNMLQQVNKEKYSVITFEDENTKGLSGSKFGQSSDKKHSYSAYAYHKGLHHVEEDDDDEKLRGGSHGIGKIASNSASMLYTMFFANKDEEGYETLGGNVQLIEHELNGVKYRSTGYFTDEDDQHFIPFENKGYHKIFQKNTRGLKIIVPYLRDEFDDKEEIVRTVCDSFYILFKKFHQF